MGKRIREERKKLGDSLESFAEKIHTTRQTLSQWEKGKGGGPTVYDLLRMCKEFRCDFGYLVGDYDCRTREATDICKLTGLSEDAVLSLVELNSLDSPMSDYVFSALDILLDWSFLPALALRFHNYISGKYDFEKLYITDYLGHQIGTMPDDATWLLLQDEISQFLKFAKPESTNEYRSRRITREKLNRLSDEDLAILDTDDEDLGAAVEIDYED